MSKNKIDFTMSELAKYNAMADEIGAIIDGLKDELKKYMSDNNLETLAGSEHKATYKSVSSNRIDTTALKKELPDIAARYTTTTNSMRFNFS